MKKEQWCLHQLFQNQADRTPEAVAAVDGDRVLTFKELDQTTDKLAGFLQTQGVTFDESVGIFMETCLEYLIAYIAILKAGGAYIPLNLAYPDAMVRKICADAGPKAIVTKYPYRNRFSSDFSVKLLFMDVDTSWKAINYDREAVSSESLDHLAFIAYTSGTTGEPKGVLVPHRAVVHSYTSRYKRSSYRPGDRVACNIFFIWEVMRPLLKGATCYVIPDDIIYDPISLLDYLALHKITEILFTPSLLETVINSVDPEKLRSKFASLNVIWLNGEVVTVNLKNKVLKHLPDHTRLLNTYSICECHDVSDADLRDAKDLPSGFCTVGHTIQGVELRLLDALMHPVSPGTAGELYVGGPCLARGYLNKPGLTALRFITIDGKRFYNTGDLALIHPDGNLEIKGRCDFMVKIRGYSIHLGAVETALLDHANVKSCAVIVEGEEGEDKRLVAYVVRDEAADWKADERTGTSVGIRNKLKPHLAHFMIPGAYVELDTIPINPVTGKLNRKLLPPPPPRHEVEIQDITLGTDAPLGEQKEVMRTLWERLLFLDKGTMRTDASFFDYGGHSLLAAELTIFIEQIFGVQLMAKDIYEYPTIKKLIHYMNSEMSDDSPWISIIEDVYLDPSIKAVSLAKPLSVKEASSIFITGTTGFLGAFLLDEVLRSTKEHVSVYCLVRQKNGDREDALNRIINNLKYYKVYDSDSKRRIIPVPGDLTSKYFGLSRERFNEMAGKIDFIFHCASLVNYIYSYAVIKPATVNGTHEILRLASTSATKPVHYISTSGIFPGGGETIYKEDSEIDPFADHLKTGYEQAKWVAEKLIWEAISRKIPVCVYRPGNIGHHSDTGAANPNDFQTMILDACMKVNCAPDKDRWFFEITPVDFFAKAIVRFAETTSHYGQVFNVVQNDPFPVRIVFNHMLEEGLIHDTVSIDAWKARLISNAEDEDDYVLRVLAQSLTDLERYLIDSNRYDCSGFEKALSAHDLKRPTIDADYFMKLFTIKNRPKPSDPDR